MNIVVLDGHALNPGDLSWAAIAEQGDFTLYERTMPEFIVQRAAAADAVFTNKVIFDRSILEQLPQLKFIGVLATGFNIVDLVAAREKGITVCNIPAYSTQSVAQTVFAHILNFTQQVDRHARSVAAGDWAASIDFCYRLTSQIELAGKTLGIVGFGQIGRAVAAIGQVFGMQVVFANRRQIPAPAGMRQVELKQLLQESDFISLNCPLTEDNKGVINRESIRLMKRTAFLINTARGPLIEEQDLADALNDGRIAGAGLDVLAVEPADPDGPLPAADHCYITPHIAWATFEARSRLMSVAARNLKEFSAGRPQNVVAV